jgi:hypothetical protein
MTYQRTAFDGQVAVAMPAIECLRGFEGVQGEGIQVIGWSRNGLVASGVAGRDTPLYAVALRQAVGDRMATCGGLLGSDVLAQGMSAQPGETVTAALPRGAQVDLNSASSTESRRSTR